MRNLWFILALIILSVGGLFVVHTLAEDNTTSSYVLVSEPTYPYHEPYRPFQGEMTYVNDTIDISGQGWGEGIAWYGKYGEYLTPQYIYKFTPYWRDLQFFWLQPDIFASRPGVWYQYYGNLTERNGNLVAFRVSDRTRNVTTTYPNGTMIETSEGIGNATDKTTTKTQVFIVPEVHVADYLTAVGDPLQTNFAKVWVFGRVSGVYDRDGFLSVNDVSHMEIGSYTLVVHAPGNNTISDVGYNPESDTIWRNIYDTKKGASIESFAFKGLQPLVAINTFYQMLSKTDDVSQTFKLDVQEPSITITRIDEVDVGNRVPIAWQPGMTLLDVRGYTNVANDTLLTFVMDEGKQNARSMGGATFTTRAIRTSPGNMSYYQVYIPINKNQMPNGMHTIKATTAIGGTMYHDFLVSELPADSYVPNASIKYIGDRNPWVPTPTPVVVTVVQTRVVERVVTVEVTPPQEMIDAAQKKATDEKTGELITNGFIIFVSLLVGFVLVRFLYRVYQNRKWYKK